MLVRFSSVATESITMFSNDAVALIKMLGATGNVPGAISAEDLQGAIHQLKTALRNVAVRAPTTPAVTAGDAEEDEKQTPVALATRAVPLVDLLERAAAKQAAVMWEPA